jgi:hypothetical protein
LDHRDRLVCVAAEVPERTSEHGSCSAGSAEAMNNDAFAALHTYSGKACRVQDAVALGRRIEWLTATDEILKQDLMRGQRGRVVVAGVEANELLEAAPMQLHPVGVSGRERHASEQGWDLEDNEQTVWTIRWRRHPHENDSAGRCRVLAETQQRSWPTCIEDGSN